MWITDEIYRLDVLRNPDTDNMLPGAELALESEVWYCYRNEAGDIVWENPDEEDYEITYINYSQDMVTVDENGTVTAGNENGGAHLDVKLSVPQKEADPYERYEGIDLNITDCYYYLETEGILLEPGTSGEIPAVLKRVDEEHPQGIVIEDATIHVETSWTDEIITQETGAVITAGNDVTDIEGPTVTKDVIVIAEWTDEDGNEICEQRSINIHICAHSYAETSRVAAKCEKKGSVTYKCSKCGTEKSEILKATGHSMKTIAAKAATCTTAGNNKYYQCKTCKKYFKDATGKKATTVAAETLKATGHSMKTTAAKAATCTTAGNNKYYQCKNCKKYFKDATGKKATTVKAETINAKGHNYKLRVTKATLTKDGSSVMKCSCGTEKKSVIAYPKTVKLSKTTYTYTGKTQKNAPTLTVKDRKGKKISSKNYTVTGLEKYKNVGTYTVKVKFKGNYSGTKTLTFSIVPKTTSISEVTAAKKGFTVKWKKQTSQTNGYQIQYSTSKNFKKAKTETISKNKTTSKTITELTAKKKYYVRIRTYKTVKVNGKSTKIYSEWSDYATVTTKK